MAPLIPPLRGHLSSPGAGFLFPRYPAGRRRFRLARINGLPGFVTTEPDGAVQSTALQIENGRIAAIHIMRNPDKLSQVVSSLGLHRLAAS
jgi:hypothetical protein